MKYLELRSAVCVWYIESTACLIRVLSVLVVGAYRVLSTGHHAIPHTAKSEVRRAPRALCGLWAGAGALLEGQGVHAGVRWDPMARRSHFFDFFCAILPRIP